MKLSSYSIQLRTIVESFTQYNHGLTTREKIEAGRRELFNFDYPIFDENYRKIFETHFIRNFYMREIGTEVEGLFIFNLETWLNINMPYYNKLFESELIEFNPLENSSRKKTYTKVTDKTQNDTEEMIRDTVINDINNVKTNLDNNRDSTTDSTNIDDDFNRMIRADTPDSRLNLTSNDGQGILEYASEITENNVNNVNNEKTKLKDTLISNEKMDSTRNNTNNVDEKNTLDSVLNNVEDYVENITAKAGIQTYPEMIQKFRDSFLRIEKKLFYEMNELFMLVY